MADGDLKRDLTFREVLGLAATGWPLVLIFLSSVGGLVSAGVPAPNTWWALGPTIGLLVIGTIASLFVKPTYVELRRTKVAYDAQLAERRGTYQLTLHGYLRELARAVGIDSAGFRVSAYIHDGKAFTQMARYSYDPVLEKSGRSVYPEDQGMIGKTWREGQGCRTRLPADPAEYARVMESEFGMPADVTTKLTMRPLSLGGIRVNGTDGAVGVVMLEGSTAQAVNAARMKRVAGSDAWVTIVKHLTDKEIAPRISTASKAGF